jgi:hypothetical protein
MTLLELQKKLHQEKNSSEIIQEYLSGDDEETRRIFVSSIAQMHIDQIKVMLSLYIDNSSVLTVRDMVKSVGTLFEINNETYQCAGIFNGSPKFRKLGDRDLTIRDFSMDDKVRRIF